MRVLWIVILLCGLLAVLPAAAGGRDAPAVAGAAATAPAYAPVPPWWRTLVQRVRARAPFLARVRLAPLRARPPLLATLPGRPLSRVRIQAARIYRIATERPNGLRNMCTNLAIRKIQFALGHPRADRTLGYRLYAAIVEPRTRSSRWSPSSTRSPRSSISTGPRSRTWPSCSARSER